MDGFKEDRAESAQTIEGNAYYNYHEGFTDESLLTVAISMLTERHREIIQLKYYHGYTVKEIARILDMRPDTVQRALTRAKRQLEKTLKELREEE